MMPSRKLRASRMSGSIGGNCPWQSRSGHGALHMYTSCIISSFYNRHIYIVGHSLTVMSRHGSLTHSHCLYLGFLANFRISGDFSRVKIAYSVMAPLIRNISRQEVQWVNSSSSCTYNKICFFRRTGFVVYLADHATIIGHFLIISASNRTLAFPPLFIYTDGSTGYNELQDQSIPGSLMLGLTPATYLAASLSGCALASFH